MSDQEPMDEGAVLEGLNRALLLQYRSALQLALSAGSLTGVQAQGITGPLQEFAAAEVEDARHLVEKIAALGGDPTTEVAELRFEEQPDRAIEWLIDTESEAIEALKDVIPAAGDEGRSEALEHLLEHLIMRKQNQVDLLLRARRGG